MLAAITQAPSPQAPTAPAPRLVHAAHEFEAQLMKELLKPLISTNGLMGADGDTGSASALGDYAGEALGRALSDRGGFGIADRIIAQVSQSDASQSGNRTQSAPVIRIEHHNHVREPRK